MRPNPLAPWELTATCGKAGPPHPWAASICHVPAALPRCGKYLDGRPYVIGRWPDASANCCRIDKLRVYYEEDKGSVLTVSIRAVGVKERSQIRIGGEVVIL